MKWLSRKGEPAGPLSPRAFPLSIDGWALFPFEQTG